MGELGFALSDLDAFLSVIALFLGAMLFAQRQEQQQQPCYVSPPNPSARATHRANVTTGNAEASGPATSEAEQSPPLSPLPTPSAPPPPPPSTVPSEFICPITAEVMVDPVILQDGHSFERSAIQEWFNAGHRTSPLTNLEVAQHGLIPNHALRSRIRSWQEEELKKSAEDLRKGAEESKKSAEEPKKVKAEGLEGLSNDT